MATDNKEREEQLQEQLVQGDSKSGALTKQHINTLVQAGVIPKGTPVEQIMVFAQICKEKGLSPFSAEIYLVKYNRYENGRKVGETYTPIVGIDGLRKLCDRSNAVAGVDAPEFNRRSDGSFETLFEVQAKYKELSDLKKGVTCLVRVWKMMQGQRVAFEHEANFGEFFNAKNPKWSTMPFQMITNIAEKFARKKGWSSETSGVHLEEEQAAFEDTQTMQLSQWSIDGEGISDREEFIDEVTKALQEFTELTELSAFLARHPAWRKDKEVLDLFAEREQELKVNE